MGLIDHQQAALAEQAASSLSSMRSIQYARGAHTHGHARGGSVLRWFRAGETGSVHLRRPHYHRLMALQVTVFQDLNKLNAFLAHYGWSVDEIRLFDAPNWWTLLHPKES